MSDASEDRSASTYTEKARGLRLGGGVLVDARQLRAARAILGWTVRDLAERAGVNRTTVSRIEAETTLPKHAHAAGQMAFALEAAGIVFGICQEGPAVAFKAPTQRTRARYRRRIV